MIQNTEQKSNYNFIVTEKQLKNQSTYLNT